VIACRSCEGCGTGQRLPRLPDRTVVGVSKVLLPPARCAWLFAVVGPCPSGPAWQAVIEELEEP